MGATEDTKSFLVSQILRINHWIYSRPKLLPESDWPLVDHLQSQAKLYEAKLDAIAAAEQNADLIQRLDAHDSHFSDLDPSICDAERTLLVRSIREGNSKRARFERRIEQFSATIYENRNVVNILMDKFDQDFGEADPLRPSNRIENISWAKSELNKVRAAIVEARQLISIIPETGIARDDLTTYLHLLSEEIDLAREFCNACLSIDRRLS